MPHRKNLTIRAARLIETAYDRAEPSMARVYAEVVTRRGMFRTRHFFRVRGANHEIIAQSEVYTTQQAALHSLMVLRGVNPWQIIEVEL